MQCGLSSALMMLLLLDMCTYTRMAICVHPYCIRVGFFISDGWEIISDQPAGRDEITSVEQTHGQAVFRAAGGDEARARRHVSCG